MSLPTAYEALEPKEVWRHFAALNGIPRPSRKEAAARSYVQGVAAAAGARHEVDAKGNAVVYVPADPGLEGASPVAVQAHLDMVCEKRPEVEHDFDRDPIRPRREGDLVFGSGTTLGADNGIGAACALALLTDPSVKHGPLELIFTVEEEIGLFGAAALDPSLVRSRLLINLDSEDPAELTVGCAGGGDAVLTLPFRAAAPPAGSVGRRLIVAGLKGGHSGVQIHEPLANALKLLTETLQALRERGLQLPLALVSGGNARNAIPRDAEATLAVPESGTAALDQALQAVLAPVRERWRADEPGLDIHLEEVRTPPLVLNAEDAGRLLSLLRDLPHGPLVWSEKFPGKVETSSNLAQVRMEPDAVRIGTSTRSFITEEIRRVQGEIRARAEAAGASVEVREGYGGWEPDPESELLRTAVRVFTETQGMAPRVEVIHAGLECGVIAAALPGLQAISFGPRIQGAHTPEERVSISTVAGTWKLLTGLVRALAGTS